MKRLHVSLVNHTPVWRKTLVDLLDWVVVGFTEAGFEVTVADEDFVPGVPNLIFENNLGHQAFMNHFGRGQKKFPFICMVTEAIAGDLFLDLAGNWNGTTRYRDFLEMTRHVDGYLTPVPANMPVLARFGPTTFFEFGFSERLVSAVPVDQWKYDHCYAGALTQYRRSVLDEISKRGVRVALPGGATLARHTAVNASSDIYLELTRTSAINLYLKPHSNWPMSSPSRLARIAHSLTAAAVERTPTRMAISDLFQSFDGLDDFMSKFVPVDRARIRREAEERLDRYRSTLPLKREIERNIDECPALIGK